MMQPAKIGKYEILDKLGRGTTADVYLAKDTLMGRKVALKVVEPETTDLEPFFKEARLLARLQHPNIVTIHGSDLIDGKVVVDMEYVPGKTLRQLLKDEKLLTVDRALKIAAQILNALAYAHGMGVIHRDMKPANILIGPEDTVKVVDFGIADVLASQGYLAGAGTFSHMAPECFEDKSDWRSDLYSVGVILYEMLVGELPVQAERNTLTAWKEALDRQKKPKPLSAFLPNVPNGLQGIVSLALTHDKQKRFQTAEAFLDVLKRNGFYALPNTEAELRLIDRFEAAYNRIDKHLRQELNADRKTGFADVVRQYAQQHPEWQSERDLLRLGRVRNELRHELMEANQWRPVPVATDIRRLEELVKTPIGGENVSSCEDARYPIRYDKYDVVDDGSKWPLPGYVWLTEATNDLRAVWSPGSGYRGKYTGLVASEEEGEWVCGPGYDWDTCRYIGVCAAWSPGKAHPDYPNVIASVEEGKWRPSFHYEWVMKTEGIESQDLLDQPIAVETTGNEENVREAQSAHFRLVL